MKVGDKVEIIGNIPFQLKDKPRPLLGRITEIDGAHILVKPKYQRYECEFYSGELRLIEDIKWGKIEMLSKTTEELKIYNAR